LKRVGISPVALLSALLVLGLAAGAIPFVVSHEVIPETHRNGLMAGFALMMTLDTTLG
jgi:ZIP family zinc transporter